MSFLKKLIFSNKITTFAFFIVFIYSLIAIFSKLGLIASDWNTEYTKTYHSPSCQYIFGTDIFGRSVFKKIIKGTELALSVGFIVAIFSMAIGLLFGVLSGYFGSFIDDFFMWIYTTISSIPSYILLVSVSYILGKSTFSIYSALALSYWGDVFIIIRNEVIKQRDREYVLAATSMGASHFRKIFYHIIPNIMNVLLIKSSYIFQQAIKSEVVLSYLGLGNQDNPSWGRMIDEAKIELMKGVWWQLFFATFFMFLIVLSFNILSDRFRVLLDPKLKK
jgi:ABC-type dipeptide/oligopeptide/nickel transport system permease subunit